MDYAKEIGYNQKKELYINILDMIFKTMIQDKSQTHLLLEEEQFDKFLETIFNLTESNIDDNQISRIKFYSINNGDFLITKHSNKINKETLYLTL